MLKSGIYEKLITELLQERLNNSNEQYYIEKKVLDRAEASEYLTRFLSKVIHTALELFPNNDDRLLNQLELSNSIIRWLSDYLKNVEISENILVTTGDILSGLLEIKNPIAADFKKYLEKITPKTGLVQSELFTGSNVGLSLESELRREILSSDEIWWLVSFIKWTGIRIFIDTLKEATSKGTKLKIITTSYMGATDQKAVDFLSALPNTEIRLSYNTERERLHAKAYLFRRKSGYHTGYIGSSNLSHAALTSGLEWNLKITTQEIPHIIEKFKSTFETYWASSDFEIYNVKDINDKERLMKALKNEKKSNNDFENQQHFFDIEPHAYQKEILQRLLVERTVHNRYRNLVVAATGTGKTVISAFDFRSIYKENPATKLLFIAHREEILRQSLFTFQMILRSHQFGELWVGNSKPEHYRHLFVSVQMLSSKIDHLEIEPDFYDYIIVDEVHHIAADSYRNIINFFKPKILLGLTATPERNDGTDIRSDFCNVIAAELRLPEAINHGYLCPFQYFGIDDTVDLSNVAWVKGRYLPSELTGIYMANDQRVGHIIRTMFDLIDDINRIKALAFCVTQEHAKYMAEKFLLKGIRASVLTSNNSDERVRLRDQLAKGEINILCVVDIFNEGVDIPEIDTVLFLRPTESLTIFLQQLGRGLRLSQGKDSLTVLDFVGNAHAEYDFSQKFRALVGKSHYSITDEIEDNFPHLPLGCSILLQKQAKEIILRNIKNAIVNRNKLISWIQVYNQHSSVELSLRNFLIHNPQVSIEDIYKIKIDGGGGWNRLCIEAGLSSDLLDREIEQAIFKGLSKRLLQSTSVSYLLFLKDFFMTGH